MRCVGRTGPQARAGRPSSRHQSGWTPGGDGGSVGLVGVDLTSGAAVHEIDLAPALPKADAVVDDRHIAIGTQNTLVAVISIDPREWATWRPRASGEASPTTSAGRICISTPLSCRTCGLKGVRSRTGPSRGLGGPLGRPSGVTGRNGRPPGGRRPRDAAVARRSCTPPGPWDSGFGTRIRKGDRAGWGGHRSTGSVAVLVR